jgi:hypothetical protein
VSAVRDGRYLLKQESGERAVEGRIVPDTLRSFGKSIAFKVYADSGTVYHIDDLTLTDVGSEDVAFSGDGKRWALLIRRDSSHPYALLQDDRETPMPKGYPYGGLQLSFDGSHSAQAIGDGRCFVVVDGQAVGDSKAVRSVPSFAPRGPACAWIYQTEEPTWKGDNGLLWVRLVLPGDNSGQPRIADFGPWDGCGIGFQDDGTLAIYGIRPQSTEVQRLLVKPDL